MRRKLANPEKQNISHIPTPYEINVEICHLHTPYGYLEIKGEAIFINHFLSISTV